MKMTQQTRTTLLDRLSKQTATSGKKFPTGLNPATNVVTITSTGTRVTTSVLDLARTHIKLVEDSGMSAPQIATSPWSKRVRSHSAEKKSWTKKQKSSNVTRWHFEPGAALPLKHSNPLMK